MDPHAKITYLPVEGAERPALIAVANAGFERVIEQIEPENEALTRSLWNAGDYIDNHLPLELGMPLDEVVYLIEAFLVRHVIDLAVEADRRAMGATPLN